MAVRDLYGTVMNEGASKGILVTTSHYGRAAYKFAKDKPLELLEGPQVGRAQTIQLGPPARCRERRPWKSRARH